MSSATRFCVEGFVLTVWPECYLVEVRPAAAGRDYATERDSLSDLPDWVFRSRLAIWLLEGREEIRKRAFAGERIKRRLAVLAGLQPAACEL